jgi:serine/threonine-protein kinase
MAELYLARALGIEGFEKLCVIKQILPQLNENREFIEMFLDEARLAATLHHSNIVQVYDIGAVEGRYFFSMEFLHGEDVRQILKATRGCGRELPLEHVLAIVVGACAGLNYAHDKTDSYGQPLGIVHRDVSPANVFVTYEGGVKLVDFGIAKASTRNTETRAGTLKGKIQYMSPEQCRGLPIDRRSDIFSLSIMLWELTVGRRLYDGRTDFEVLEAICHTDARRPSALVPGYPPALEQIVLRGLRRRPEDRFQTAEDLQLALEEFARARRLPISSVSLARFLKATFAAKLDALQRAQEQGLGFAEYLAEAPDDAGDPPAPGSASRRRRTDTSATPLPPPASPATVAGSPHALVEMMVNAAREAAAADPEAAVDATDAAEIPELDPDDVSAIPEPLDFAETGRAPGRVPGLPLLQETDFAPTGRAVPDLAEGASPESAGPRAPGGRSRLVLAGTVAAVALSAIAAAVILLRPARPPAAGPGAAPAALESAAVPPRPNGAPAARAADAAPAPTPAAATQSAGPTGEPAPRVRPAPAPTARPRAPKPRPAKPRPQSGGPQLDPLLPP